MADELLNQILNKLNSMDEQNKAFHNEFIEFSDKVKVRLDRHDKKLDTITEQVVKSSEQLTSIKGTLDTQDQTIDVLSARSIKHEAGLNKALKKA